MSDIIKNPYKQLAIILICVMAYWTWDIVFHKQNVPTKVVTQSESTAIPDTTYYESREDVPESTLEENVSEYELKIQYWDMILGHLSSIFGSLAALLSPLITVYLNKKGYFNTEQLEET